MKLKFLLAVFICMPFLAAAQHDHAPEKFTRADTLRGSLNPHRSWWDVIRYDIDVKPDYASKSIQGKVKIVFRLSDLLHNRKEILKRMGRGFHMQIDLQEPLKIDSIIYKDSCVSGTFHGRKPDTYTACSSRIKFKRSGDTYLLELNRHNMSHLGNRADSITIYYHGIPKEAKNAPWDGGWIWSRDSLDRPWMSVAVQGLGASAWYPCKDHQSDEPDSGASLRIIVPDSLVAVGNGRLSSEETTSMISFTMDTAACIEVLEPGHRRSTWTVKNPINNYTIIPSIGKYVNWNDTLMGENGRLDLGFWVLDYNLGKAKLQFEQVKPMLRCFEHWFGPYPFYEDSYKLVETPFLGMEHQSAIAYGNLYRNGYRGRDLSGTGWGSKWDFIIIHESGHEWFANNITTRDIADMWVHEGFTNYSETLYTEWLFGKAAADEYNYGIRKNIGNKETIIGRYGVNRPGSTDMYYKAGNMIHTIRKAINNDEKFRQILRGLNKTFRHQTVTTQQVENFISREAGIPFQKTFNQYLRTTQLPRLEFYFGKDGRSVSYRWANCIKGFDLPLVIGNKRYAITTKWNTMRVTNNDLRCWKPMDIEKQYYITAKQVSKP